MTRYLSVSVETGALVAPFDSPFHGANRVPENELWTVRHITLEAIEVLRSVPPSSRGNKITHFDPERGIHLALEQAKLIVGRYSVAPPIYEAPASLLLHRGDVSDRLATLEERVTRLEWQREDAPPRYGQPDPAIGVTVLFRLHEGEAFRCFLRTDAEVDFPCRFRATFTGTCHHYR